MQRILILLCMCLITGSLSGCGIFCAPRHEVLVVEQSGTGEQTGQEVSDEIPLVSHPDPETVANTMTAAPYSSFRPRTYISIGYPASFYAGCYPYWGYRPFRSFGYYRYPYRRYYRRPCYYRGYRCR